MRRIEHEGTRLCYDECHKNPKEDIPGKGKAKGELQ